MRKHIWLLCSLVIMVYGLSFVVLGNDGGGIPRRPKFNRIVSQSRTSETNQAEPNSWRGIIPLVTTKDRVDKILSEPQSYYGSVATYRTDDERVDIVYSAGPCELSRSEKWNVGKEVVLTIEVRPSKRKLISELHLDPKKYPRLQQSHPENWYIYRNSGEGVVVETILFERREEIDSIKYFPRKKDLYLKCP